MATAERPGRFLTADWRHLVMLNFEVEPAILERFVPPGTQLDYFRGRCFISLVGFLFLNTRVLGVPLPLHRDFEELNLRFYVRRRLGGEWRRGVVFIKEIVPRRAVEHPAWRVWKAREAELECDGRGLYGEALAAPLAGPPSSAFLAEGSPVTVYRGQRLAD